MSDRLGIALTTQCAATRTSRFVVMVGDCIDVGIALLSSCDAERVFGLGYGAVRLLILENSFRTVRTFDIITSR